MALPTALRFAIVVVTSFFLSAFSLSLIATITGPELAAVSRDLTAPWQIAAIVGWKLLELSIAWYAGFDWRDLTYLTLLNQVPHYFLLNTFFGVDYTTTAAPLAVDILTIALPFALMRRLNSVHRASAIKTENQQVAEDRGVQYTVGLLGATIYTLVVYWSFATVLPVFMVTHFDGVRSLEKVHNTALTSLLTLFIPLGFAASQFIAVPGLAAGGKPALTDKSLARGAFDPATASLPQTIAKNLHLSGLTPRAVTIAKRTATLAAASAVNTFLRSYFTLEGTEIVGCLGWAGLWAFAAGATGFAYAWVSNE